MKHMHGIVIVCAVFAGACSSGTEPAAEIDGKQVSGHVETHTEAATGARGGRLLADGDFQIELAIFEDGVEPTFRAYAIGAGQPLDPGTVQLEVELTRLGGRLERITFAPEEDYLQGASNVREPHSFNVHVTAVHAGRTYQWNYDSFEGRTQIDVSIARESGIETETAGPATIRESLLLHGTVVPDPQRVYRLHARFPGIVKEVRKRIGDTVRADEVLAVIESNESLQRYSVTAPAAGVVVAREVNPGAAVGNEPLMTIVDLSSVWVELASFQHDMGRIVSGQPVIVRDVDGHQSAEGRVDNIAPVGSAASQSMTVRVVLSNPDGRWRPGLFVTGEVTVAENVVPLAVRRMALQTFRDWTVVFEQVGDLYEVRPLTLGRSDAERVEVLGGMLAGAAYVSTGSYLIKADIEKSGASHDH